MSSADQGEGETTPAPTTVEISRRKMAGEDLGVDFTDFTAPVEDISSDAPPSSPDQSPELIDYKPWTGFPKRELSHNRFVSDPSWLDASTPDVALEGARREARKNDGAWLPPSVALGFAEGREGPMAGVLAGTYDAVAVDPGVVSTVSRTLAVLGSAAELLSAVDGTFRFKYNGPVKHRAGMEAWCEKMLREDGAEVRGVRFECRRTRDADEM
mmetsp:Transcript_25157/g.50165  ORF Transcript_25157/g.50165 Transcript_25157/m.50165 type:complete len:213 (+) Transcript_25157:1103-1741(+)